MCGYLCFALALATPSSFLSNCMRGEGARHLFCPRKVRGPHLVACGPGIVGSKPDLDQDLGSIPDKDIYSS
jgi:hypothetical protein